MTANDISLLISRVALGNREAFTDLYSATSSKLFAVCLRILNNRAEAEDALQEIYVKIWRDASKYAPSDFSPMSWLIAIARNHSIDKIRASKPAAVDIDEMTDLSDEAADPEKEAIASSDRRGIDRCLNELPDTRAAAIRGAYLEGYSYQELAEQQNIPLNTIRTWLRRGLLKLKECLER
ncbi:sigma-70 family RNA polymerase sigma factor [Sneathiella sp.]|uniref:sigma-70 family RNA polymerase sigma factor n=1 Tax=Sneathiella sp. TaxID=1964365 RepID=UPI002613AAF5|nr:sigma-70 family RNA polymerase sigma factor [Sneathiella sp.]MDF2366662.1 sigma-70 family RNA polymerase sigma factor [Sneathiella sp.]